MWREMREKHKVVTKRKLWQSGWVLPFSVSRRHFDAKVPCLKDLAEVGRLGGCAGPGGRQGARAIADPRSCPGRAGWHTEKTRPRTGARSLQVAHLGGPAAAPRPAL